MGRPHKCCACVSRLTDRKPKFWAKASYCTPKEKVAVTRMVLGYCWAAHAGNKESLAMVRIIIHHLHRFLQDQNLAQLLDWHHQHCPRDLYCVQQQEKGL